MAKINVAQVVSIAGAALGIAGSLLSGWAQQKNIQADIAKQVEEALKNK